MSRLVPIVIKKDTKPECKHQILRYIKISRVCDVSLRPLKRSSTRKSREIKSPSARLDVLSVRYAHFEQLNIFDYVSFRSCFKPLRNVDHLTLGVPFSRTDVFKNSFFVRICRLWNDLPLSFSIRESNTLSIFRKNLMTFYHDKFLNIDFFKLYIVFYQSFLR